ncbi:hypothetical protein BOTBODRAFT_26801 [Botryobasidium botryosum FD-172 SS1]|uniref:Uncharacterized protein n=1 Tax=Botryobasidium botryosum (strain FD-172 SS1) TaxID=930990 RepID=A0A067MYU8_BOTB1|nr:hypothetical protein BOTBODRAFT_26801 [Botryobasidium botryosum FD-172 SS1]
MSLRLLPTFSAPARRIPSVCHARVAATGAFQAGFHRPLDISGSSPKRLSSNSSVPDTSDVNLRPSFGTARWLHTGLEYRARELPVTQPDCTIDPLSCIDVEILVALLAELPKGSVERLPPNPIDVIDAFLSVHIRAPSRIPLHAHAYVASIAAKKNLIRVFNASLNHAVQIAHKYEDELMASPQDSTDMSIQMEHGAFLQHIILFASQNHSLVSSEDFLRLFRCPLVCNESTLSALNPIVVSRAIGAFLSLPDPIAPHTPLIRKILPALLHTFPDPGAESSTHTAPYKGTWVLFNLITRFIKESEYGFALEVFSTLAKANWIPEDVIRRTSHSSAPPGESNPVRSDDGGSAESSKRSSFETIVLETLVRCCIKWGWWKRAVELTISLLDTAAWTAKKGQLVHDLIQALNCELTPLAAEHCAALICATIRGDSQSAGTIVLPNHALWQFYDTCASLSLPGPMSRVYQHLRCIESGEEDVLRDASLEIYQLKAPLHPPPKNAALEFLLKHYVVTIKDSRKARKLAQFALAYQRSTHIPILTTPHIPGYLSVLARGRLYSEVKEYWDSFRNLKGGEMIGGNARVVSRLVSTFVRLSNAEKDGRRKSSRSGVVGQGSEAELGPHPSSARPSHPSVSSTEAIDRLAAQVFESTAEPQDPHYQFASAILDDFTQMKQPLASAAHHDLTTIAACSFSLGRFDVAFTTLNQILSRREIPDAHDINVLLLGLAKHNPARAAKFLEMHMQDGKGTYEEYAIGWTSIVQTAIAQGDWHTADRLLGVKTRYGPLVKHMTSQGLGTILLGILDAAQSPQQRREAVDKALWLLRKVSQRDPRSMPDPRIGFRCVAAALGAGLAQDALSFWRILMKGKIPAGDRSHLTLRKGLARLVIKTRPRNQARVICAELELVAIWDKVYRSDSD